MTAVYLHEDESLRALDAPGGRPLRWADWHPNGSRALLCGNRGQVLSFDGSSFSALDTESAANLRGVAWSPDGSRAMLCGNGGAVVHYDGSRFRALSSPTIENLRRAAWAPDGSCALIIGNGGTVLRFDGASGELRQLPGDRAHTLRSIAWRPDGAYALIGAYASHYAWYPSPHMLYRCDGRYTQALLTTDESDDAVAISWHPGAMPETALIVAASHGAGGIRMKLYEYDGAVFAGRRVDTPPLLGAAWAPDGAYALLCGERGALLRYDGRELIALKSGTEDNLLGPFWRPGSKPLALLLRGPAERVFTA